MLTTERSYHFRSQPHHIFGAGRGKVSASKARQIDKIAREHGAELVTYHEPGCGCGRGCRRDCRARARYYFATRNYGSPHNERTANEVISALRAAGIALP
jgi:hypothetical protein